MRWHFSDLAWDLGTVGPPAEHVTKYIFLSRDGLNWNFWDERRLAHKRCHGAWSAIQIRNAIDHSIDTDAIESRPYTM